jgi:GT2 family glycosyltransferase
MSPFSWELAKARQDTTLIAVLLPSGVLNLVTFEWAMSYANMQKPPHDVMKISGMPYGEARTQAAYQCLNGGYQWLFFLDGDGTVPSDTIPRLMAHRLPIVSGMYHQRFPTWLPDKMEVQYLPAIFNEAPGPDGKMQRVALTDFKPGSLIEVSYVPGGCLLIHRSVFERMLQAGIKRFFEWTLTADTPSTGGRSEDFEFVFRARQLGFKCFVDTSVIGVHETQAQVKDGRLVPKL